MKDNVTDALASFTTSRASRLLHASWKRSRQYGLDPSKPMDPPTAGDVDTASRLFRAAAPVLHRIRNGIDGERLSVMLVGAQAEMLTTVNGCRQIDTVVERIGATPGAVWREDTTGTNALATPFETRSPLFVRGDEHFMEGLHGYSCYGRPIFNPLNGHLMGVLDVMSVVGAESSLMRPFIDSAIAEIEQNIQDTAGSRTHSVVRAFEDAARHPAAMVVAVSRSMVLQSSMAARALSDTDVTALQQLADGVRGTTRAECELTSGQTAQIEMESIEGSDAVLIRLRTRQRPAVPRAATPLRRRSRVQQGIDDVQAGTGSAVIVGEPGSGRTTALGEVAAGLAVRAIDGRTAAPADVEDELRALACEAFPDVLTIDNLDLLSKAARDLIENLLVCGRPRILAATSVPGDADHARLLDLFDARLDLPTLRDQRSELLSTLNEIAGPGVRYRFTPQATRVLESYSWPGNHRELATVLRSLARSRGTLIDVADLPTELRMKATTKQMTPWQQASCDAIMRAMEIYHGNKAHAADYLGISRSTLYHHIKEYGIIV
ncbi:sigma-54-dependent Fis family transcriptional regulator [Gordonia phosphorivorans]|uniref:Sigma-54-dependent Fis family transcriptional regulator n=1 Tax=Gordonia phosphorivorans TaxID=1056982 RepID=A0ABV6H451_9ACTN